MASTKREREMARRRLQRQAERRAQQQARRRKRVAVVSSALAALLVIGAVAVLAKSGTKHKTAAKVAATPAASGAGAVACGAAKPAPVAKQTFPAEPPLSVDQKAMYTLALDTSCGPITVTMDATKAPHTVNSLVFLADKKFYDGTFCHRETTSPGLTVLQCGDPEGTGGGGPGYTLAEENLTGATYSRGVMAMAKTSAPHSTGSQFFLIDKDSQLPPQYTVVGTITGGLDVLDKILAIGQDDKNGQGDGAPKQTVYLNAVTTKKV
ncbi:MAG: peptidylprolyl isomerase [Actinomycetota bacterium]|nr:peptidylprolyl isomerase [Actinomycetota bacterium]